MLSDWGSMVLAPVHTFWRSLQLRRDEKSMRSCAGATKPVWPSARSLGCVWAGWSDELPPEPLDAAIIFAPVGALVPRALQAVRKGGRVVCAGIYMSDIPAFPYRILWEEREIRSVANLERRDGTEFFEAMAGVAIRTHVETFPLAQANEALDRLREGRLTGAAVLIP